MVSSCRVAGIVSYLCSMDQEEPRSGYFFITVFLIVLVAIVVSIYLYVTHVHSS
jgi:hypothetical protein